MYMCVCVHAMYSACLGQGCTCVYMYVEIRSQMLAVFLYCPPLLLGLIESRTHQLGKTNC